jgi:uncharacterized protein
VTGIRHNQQERRLIVSLHDVAPPFEAEIRAQLGALAAIGVRRCALKVVPNWHGQHPLDAASRLVDLLARQVAGGSELVLHGNEHRPRGPMRGPVLTRLRGQLFAADAAEFLTMSASQARRAVLDGIETMSRAGLPPPAYFCAPGWLLSAEGLEGLVAAGMRYLISMFTVRDLATGDKRWLPGFGYMGAPPAHEAGVQLLNAVLRPTARARARVARVYLHPQGGTRAPGVRRTLDVVRAMVERDGWRVSTFAEVFGHD